MIASIIQTAWAAGIVVNARNQQYLIKYVINNSSNVYNKRFDCSIILETKTMFEVHK